MITILIGIDDSPRSEPAVDFVRPLAAASGATVVLACAFPYHEWAGLAGNRKHHDVLQAQAEEALARAAARLEGIDPARVKTIPVACPSPPRALDGLAHSEGADLIVLGSTHTGHLRRIVPGSTAERLLHGAPCPVAVVPSGYRPPAEGERPRVGVAYNGSKESVAALHAATQIARALDAELRVISVLAADQYVSPALMSGPSQVVPREYLETEARAALDRAVAGLPEDVRAEPVFAAREVVHELAEQSTRLDLLVAGSRGYGPTRSVLLGGVTGRLIREAACPLIVVPRGIEKPLGALFGVAAAAVS
jgi:nucleotide-binding universal stress UspA family protein